MCIHDESGGRGPVLNFPAHHYKLQPQPRSLETTLTPIWKCLYWNPHSNMKMSVLERSLQYKMSVLERRLQYENVSVGTLTPIWNVYVGTLNPIWNVWVETLTPIQNVCVETLNPKWKCLSWKPYSNMKMSVFETLTPIWNVCVGTHTPI